LEILEATEIKEKKETFKYYLVQERRRKTTHWGVSSYREPKG
jgi:hypothetical protein